MGGKHYYCDYCDRSFKDAPGVRKKHLTSLLHIKNRDSHYKMYKDPKEILEEERDKMPCKRFLNNGECHFEGVCRYTHYTPAQLQELQMIVAQREESKRFTFPNPEYVVKEFLEKAEPAKLLEEPLPDWPLPEKLKGCTDLPPSMRPMTLKHFDSADFPEWGWR